MRGETQDWIYMNLNKNKKSKIEICFIISLIVAICIVIYAGFTFKGNNVKIDNEKCTTFNDNWYYEDDNGTRQYLYNLPVNTDNPVDKTLVIHNTLPSLDSTINCMCFRSSNQQVTIRVDGKIIYQFGNNDSRTFSETPGSAWQYVKINSQMSEKEITIELTSPYSNCSGFVSAFYIGTKSSIVFKFFTSRLVNAFICLVTMLVGFGLILSYFITRKSPRKNISLTHLGTFAILISIWSLLETQTVQLEYGNVAVLTLITFLILAIAPIPMLIYIKNSYFSTKPKVFDILCIFALANFVIQIILQFAGIIDFMEILIVSHILILVSFVIIIYASIHDYHITKNKDSLLPLHASIVLMIFVGIDIFRYYVINLMDFSIYFRIGFLIYIIMMASFSLRKTSILIEKGIKADMYERLAYEDILLKCKNRTYFEAELAKQSVHLNSNTSLAVITFDMNNLKRTNDMFGHHAGDEMLMVCNNMIQTAFGHLGTLARIGGDEFSMLLVDIPEDSIQKSIQTFVNNIGKYNLENNQTLQIAYGYAFYVDSLDKNLESTLSRADKNMYSMKKKLKISAGI